MFLGLVYSSVLPVFEKFIGLPANFGREGIGYPVCGKSKRLFWRYGGFVKWLYKV